MDFEKAVWEALGLCLPMVPLGTDGLPLGKEAWPLQCIHAPTTIRAHVCELMALPNWPASHIEPAFQEMKLRCPNDDRLHALQQHMQTTWILSPATLLLHEPRLRDPSAPITVLKAGTIA